MIKQHNRVAFVAGATGFVGQALVAELARTGWKTVAHVRADSSKLSVWESDFAAFGASTSSAAWTPAGMREALAECRAHAVFCCIGTTKKRMDLAGSSANSYETVDFGLAKLLAEAAAAAGGVACFVYVSSAGTSPSSRGAYLQWRWRAEEAVRAAGVPYVIARPSVITGERSEARPLEHVAGTVLDGLLGVAGLLGAKLLRDRYRSTDATTLARALARLADDRQALNKTIESELLH